MEHKFSMKPKGAEVFKARCDWELRFLWHTREPRFWV